MLKELKLLYPGRYRKVHEQIRKKIGSHPKKKRGPSFFSESDIVLIAYPDHVHDEGAKPLSVLKQFISKFFGDAVSLIHILPFFPSTSDDGFAIADFSNVDASYGSWKDIYSISKEKRLMVDLVLNHVSVSHPWFKNCLEGDPYYQQFFHVFEKRPDASLVFRPRSAPLFTRFDAKQGTRYVWTTFSADQVDLNYAHPDVLLAMLDVVKLYISKGVRILRLDAVAYIWKDLSRASISEPETHAIVRIIRSFVDAIAPGTLILTETNVDHQQNISYFGNGRDEAHMVYNFTLPPLLLYTFFKNDAQKLSRWMRSLSLPSKTITFFNFTASHDGVGLLPLKDIVTDEEVSALVKHCKKNGGLVSYKTVGKRREPYEINIVYKEAFADIRSFLASQCIMLSLQGIPGIYFNSLIGAGNWEEGKRKRARLINREKFSFASLREALSGKTINEQASIRKEYLRMLSVRKEHPLFHPLAMQKVHDISSSVFVIERRKGKQQLFCLVNVSDALQTVDLSSVSEKKTLQDLLDGSSLSSSSIALHQYQYRWLS